MVSANQIRAIINAYLSDGDGDKFVRDFSASSYNIHKNGDAESIQLANSVERRMADLHSGHLSHSAFRDALRDMAVLPISIAYPSLLAVTSSCFSPAFLGWVPRWEAVASSVRFEDTRYASV
jgi:hypothetical protein